MKESAQNTRDGKENLRCRRLHRKQGHNNQRRYKMQKDTNSNDPGNPGHNEKSKHKDNMYIRKQSFPIKRASKHLQQN